MGKQFAFGAVFGVVVISLIGAQPNQETNDLKCKTLRCEKIVVSRGEGAGGDVQISAGQHSGVWVSGPTKKDPFVAMYTDGSCAVLAVDSVPMDFCGHDYAVFTGDEAVMEQRRIRSDEFQTTQLAPFPKKHK